MRHAVSVNQLVIWPRHEITQAWAPTGILHSPQNGTEAGGPEAGEGDIDEEVSTDEMDCQPATAARDVTVLTRNGGVCGQMGRRPGRPRRGRALALRRSAPSGLV